ncbi:MAG TPA: T9SS type A sorting domain-containing protein [Candidatus Acidoferrales bacterium]|nr:T9SS type A sorting domain-containing protein [Candidatus Acidoferrales bacterium]
MSRVALALVLVGLTARAALADEAGGARGVVDPDLWGVRGTVLAMARAGNLLFVAGSMSDVGPSTGGGVPVDPATGVPRRRFARVVGAVDAALPDGRGGWYLGGRFTAVEGVPRMNLAHVLADGRVDNWAPAVAGTSLRVRVPEFATITPGVDALVLVGGTIYVGGLFNAVGDSARDNIAAVDARTGQVQAWNPGAAGEVRALAPFGREIVAGGSFVSFGGLPRSDLAAFDAKSGAVLPWNPGADGAVDALAPCDGALYVGGEFSHVGDHPRNSLGAVDPASGAVLEWDAGLTPLRVYEGEGDWIWPSVHALAIQNGTVYAGGWFTGAGGTRRASLAAFDARTARLESFVASPAIDPNRGLLVISALEARERTLYVGGEFDSLGGQLRPNAGAVDARTGAATTWNPRADDVVNVLKLGGNDLFVGGSFACLHDWAARRGAAAIDLTTGRVAPWSPSIDGDVTGIGIIGDVVYLGGQFTTVDGELRENVAAVGARTGALLPWYPGRVGPTGEYTGPVQVATQAGKVYLGAHFMGFNGVGPNYLAQLDATTGLPTAWDAHADGVPTAFETSDSSAFYLAGGFSFIGGANQSYFAALDPGTANVLPFAPQPAGGRDGPTIFALARSGETMYAGGGFESMDGQPRALLAAVDARSGALRPWNPGADDIVEALGAHDGAVWAGGRFATIGGAARSWFAVLDTASGLPQSNWPQPDGEVRSMLVDGDRVFVGGAFHAWDGMARWGIAEIHARPSRPRTVSIEADPASAVAAVSCSIAPNPVRSSARVRLTLPQPASVSLRVYDLAGRLVATPVDGMQAAGEHDVSLEVAPWAPGIYLARVETGETRITRRFVVLH